MISTSRTEIRHILIAWFAISVAFNIALNGVSFNLRYLFLLLVSLITVGFGFVLHELGHKFVAQGYGSAAEFRADFKMLLFAVVISFTGLLFAAPGGVIIPRHLTPEKHGKIALSGPLINMILAILFYLMVFIPGDFIDLVSRQGFLINAWLAVFNLIPFGPFDGAKVYSWSKPILWLSMFMAAGLLMFFYIA